MAENGREKTNVASQIFAQTYLAYSQSRIPLNSSGKLNPLKFWLVIGPLKFPVSGFKFPC